MRVDGSEQSHQYGRIEKSTVKVISRATRNEGDSIRSVSPNSDIFNLSQQPSSISIPLQRGHYGPLQQPHHKNPLKMLISEVARRGNDVSTATLPQHSLSIEQATTVDDLFLHIPQIDSKRSRLEMLTQPQCIPIPRSRSKLKTAHNFAPRGERITGGMQNYYAKFLTRTSKQVNRHYLSRSTNGNDEESLSPSTRDSLETSTKIKSRDHSVTPNDDYIPHNLPNCCNIRTANCYRTQNLNELKPMELSFTSSSNENIYGNKNIRLTQMSSGSNYLGFRKHNVVCGGARKKPTSKFHQCCNETTENYKGTNPLTHYTNCGSIFNDSDSTCISYSTHNLSKNKNHRSFTNNEVNSSSLFSSCFLNTADNYIKNDHVKCSVKSWKQNLPTDIEAYKNVEVFMKEKQSFTYYNTSIPAIQDDSKLINQNHIENKTIHLNKPKSYEVSTNFKYQLTEFSLSIDPKKKQPVSHSSNSETDIQEFDSESVLSVCDEDANNDSQSLLNETEEQGEKNTA